MKKYTMACAALCMGLVLASCGSSKESAYRKAYEKAKAQDQVNTEEREAVSETPVVTPVVETPVVKQPENNYDNVSVRSEKLTVIDGAGLKQFSVVVGAFSVKANALGLQSQLKSEGHQAQVAFNAERNMYRVIAATFDSKADAVQSRNQFRGTYPDAWLLFNN